MQFTKLLGISIFFMNIFVFAAQNGTVNVPEADIYKDENFDSEIIENVKFGETYQISEKIYGQFYKIKLKTGKIGYIPDHELNVNGKSFEEKPYKEIAEDEKPKQNKANLKKKSVADFSEEDQPFRTNFKGITLQLINFHEETLGTLQVDNLYAIGFKNMDATSIWEVFGSFKPPKYYAEKTKGSTQGFHIWGSRGLNSMIPISELSYLRYGGSFLLHLAHTKVETSVKTYDLQDVTIGVVLDAGYVLQFKKVAFEVTAKYIFDRNNYGGLGLSLLF